MVLAIPVCFGQAAGTAQISGMVVDDAKQPVALAFVTVTRFPYNPKDGPASVSFTTGKDGKFLFTGLLPATYSGCVYLAQQRGYLDTCEWGMQSNFQIKAGQAITGVVLPITKGGQVLFEVSDPKGLKPIESPTAAAVAHYGLVADSGSQHYGRYYFSQQGKHTYILNVPFGRSMQVRVVANTAVVKDAGGNSLSTGAALPATAFVLSKGDGPKKISLSLDSVLGK